jgi:hypothetical protein
MHSTRSVFPPSSTAAVRNYEAMSWENDDFPSFHGPYDYDVLLTREN